MAVHVVLILSLVLLLAGDAAHGASTRHVLITLLSALGLVGAAAAAIVAAASRWPLLAGLVLAAAGTWLRAEIEQPPGLLLVATGLAFMGAERASGRVLVRRLVLLAQMVPLALLVTVVILIFL